MMLGAQTSSLVDVSFTRTQLVMYIAKAVFGSLGTIFLSICTTVACLTTADCLTNGKCRVFHQII